MYEQICIIMADGRAKRMEGLNKKKQLIKIDGETIIERTIRQLRKLGIEPVIATHYDDFNFLDIAHIIPENNDHEIKKFNSNKKYYKRYKETIFIWGDTYFEEKDIMEIIHTPVDKYAFFGSEYEIFGFKIKQEYYDLIDKHSQYIINHKDLDYGNTGTWGLLRRFGGFKLIANPNGIQGGITSIHEPEKYIQMGLLHILPGQSIDNDGKKDLCVLCQRFPQVQVEELIYTEKDGTVSKFMNGEWIVQSEVN